ncbi:MAG TPA: hypothetical protein PLM29_00695 [Deltaproteobacteria bacterium]|nr:hypothetical protein [Deltaproteobacteria bacterium]
MKRRDDFLSRYPDRLTDEEKKEIELVTHPRIAGLIQKIREQGKLELCIQNMEKILAAGKNGMDIKKFNEEIRKPGVYLGEPGRAEELISRCM